MICLKRSGALDSMEKCKPAKCQEEWQCQSDKVEKITAASFEVDKSCARQQFSQKGKKGMVQKWTSWQEPRWEF